MAKKNVRIADLSKELNIHRNALTLLANETAKRVEVTALNKLCEYFNCNVQDILEYVPDDNFDEKEI